LERWEAVSNHFIEMQYDENGSVYGMVHSGSRNIGKKTCDYFDNLAIGLNQKWHAGSSVPFLPVDSAEGRDYIEWMKLCVKFSFMNRRAMLEDVISNLNHYFPSMRVTTNTIEGVDGDIFQICHNYASLEHQMGKDLWIHRKGAVLARKGVIGLIPGSQSTNSFVTVGLGNAQSLESCSHGSGRKMGRKEFNVRNKGKEKEIEDEMRSKGIVFSKFKKSERGRDKDMYDLSEAGGAYKDVMSVMENQKDLVAPLVKLTPLINWKG
jgi:tRNA-splicing ligase RtcB (3'-phosphate/5'-hydroxy nucleic acid ligase)